MKIIFILLVLANLGYLIVTQLFSHGNNALSSDKVHNPEKIVILPVQQNCLEWGNFYEEQTQYAEMAIAELVSEQSYRIEVAGSTSLYWLYIPPLPNKETANRMINKLRNLGIVSFRVKDDDKWKNAISLAMYTDQQEADKYRKEIEIKGISNVMMESRNVELKKIVLYSSDLALKAQLQKLIEPFAGTQLVETKCEY